MKREDAPWARKEIHATNQAEPKLMGGGVNERGGLYFWSWSFTAKRPEDMDNFFIFHTAKYLGFDDVVHAVKDAHRDWRIGALGKPFPIPYTLSHAFEVHTKAPIRWRDFIEEIKQALNPIL